MTDDPNPREASYRGEWCPKCARLYVGDHTCDPSRQIDTARYDLKNWLSARGGFTIKES